MDVEQSDYVGVIAKMLQEHDFTEGSLGVGLIPESVCTHRHKIQQFKSNSTLSGMVNQSRSPPSYSPTTTMSTTTKHSRYNPIAPVCDMKQKGPQPFSPNNYQIFS
jgi:hypothetical protein